jgi:creatinine amidohydrolase
MSGRAGSERSLLLEEMTSPEFSKRAKTKPLVIVPFGSLEEHGSHLPLCTDAFQAEEVAVRVAEKFDAIVLPTIKYGECRSTRNFPGTISLSSKTVRHLAFDIVSELSRNGIDKVMMLTGHAGTGHMAALREGALKALENDRQLKVMVLSDYDIAYGLLGKEFPKTDGHGGEIETSRIMNIRPELVGKSRPVGRTWAPQYMLVRDPEKYFPTGIMGDSRKASAAKGKKLDDYIVRELSKLVSKNFGLKKSR